MTQPQQPQEPSQDQQNPKLPPVSVTDDDTEDESALIPVLLAVFAAYLLLRGGRDRVGLGWRQVADALHLRELMGGQLAMIAARALTKHVAEQGRPGDELWQYSQVSMSAGVEAGMRAVAEALLFEDKRGGAGDPGTKDNGGTTPTASSPPIVLARLTVQAVVNAAIVAAAAAAGWQAKTWHTKRDSRVRDAHVSMEGQVQKIADPFLAPGGTKLRYPGDPAAPIDLVINCFPAETSVSAPDVTLAIRAPYSGPLVTAHTQAGRQLTGTPNHPVLTKGGWVGLGDLQRGDQVVCAGSADRFAHCQPHVQNGPPLIDEVFRAIEDSGVAVGVNVVAVDFYGDRPSGEIEVVSADGVLDLDGDSPIGKHLREAGFVGARPVVDTTADGQRAFDLRGVGLTGSTPSEVRADGELLALLERHALHPQPVGGGSPTRFDVDGQQVPADDRSGDTESLSKALLGLAGEITLDDVVAVEMMSHAELPVYTLGTISGVFVAAGIVTHNCRCYVTPSRR